MKSLKKLLVSAAVAIAVGGLPLQSASAWWGGGPGGGPWGGGPWGGGPGGGPWGGSPWGGGPWGGGPWGGGPWGGGPWGAPGASAPAGLAGVPGWSAEEVADKYDFYAPYGPSISDIRRYHRDLIWGRPFDDLYSPLGPSPTDVRRKLRRDFHRSMGPPY